MNCSAKIKVFARRIVLELRDANAQRISKGFNVKIAIAKVSVMDTVNAPSIRAAQNVIAIRAIGEDNAIRMSVPNIVKMVAHAQSQLIMTKSANACRTIRAFDAKPTERVHKY